MTAVTLLEPRAAESPTIGRHRMRRAMLAHVAMLPLYALWVWLGAFSQFWWAGALGLGTIWIVLAYFIVRWVREGRTHIEQRIVAWGVLAWFNLLLVLPLLWEPTRRYLVPPPVVASR